MRTPMTWSLTELYRARFGPVLLASVLIIFAATVHAQDKNYTLDTDPIRLGDRAL